MCYSSSSRKLLRLRLWWWIGRGIVPSPFLLQFLVDKVHVPASLLSNLGENLEDFFLLASVGEALGGNGKGPQGNTRDATILDMSHDPAYLLRVAILQFLHLIRVDRHEGVDLGKEDERSMVKQTGDDGGAFDQPNFWERGAGRGLAWIEVGDRVHRARDVVIPGITPRLQLQPLLVTAFQPDLLITRGCLLEPWNGGSEVANLCDNVDDAMRPYLLLARVGLSREFHVDAPIIRIPSHLPVEVQAAQELHANVEPEAGGTDPGRSCVPTAFFDEGAGTGDVVHPLKRTLTHDLVHIEDDGGCRADDGVTVRVLQRIEQVARSGIVVMQRFILRVLWVYKRDVPSSTG